MLALDLGKTRHAAWLAASDLTPIDHFMIDHSRDGLAKVLKTAEEVRARNSFGPVVVFMEPTAHYWMNVAHFLEQRDVEYHLVAPLAVSRQREIEHLTYAKGDYRDSELIAALGAHGQWLARRLEPDPLWIELRALALEHEKLVSAEVGEQLAIRSQLELALPEFFVAFRDPVADTARAFLRAISRPAECRVTSVGELVTRAKELTGHALRRSKLKNLAARLEVEPSFGVERFLSAALARVDLALQRYDLIQSQREDLRARLVVVYGRTPYQRFLDTIPSVLPENHAILLGLLGDPKQFDRASRLVKLAGIEPRENHSGDAEGSHAISRRGRPEVRHLLYRIVWGLWNGNAEFSAYLEHLRKREACPLATQQAVCAAGNKYLRVIHAMCIQQKAYNPSLVVAKR